MLVPAFPRWWGPSVPSVPGDSQKHPQELSSSSQRSVGTQRALEGPIHVRREHRAEGLILPDTGLFPWRSFSPTRNGLFRLNSRLSAMKPSASPCQMGLFVMWRVPRPISPTLWKQKQAIRGQTGGKAKGDLWPFHPCSSKA